MGNHNTEMSYGKSGFKREALLLLGVYTQFLLLLGINRCQRRKVVYMLYYTEKDNFISTYFIIRSAIAIASISKFGNIKFTKVLKGLINSFGSVPHCVKS